MFWLVNPYMMSKVWIVVAGNGAYAISGRAAQMLATRKLVVSAGTFVIDGKPAGLYRGLELPADVSSYGIIGQTADLYKTVQMEALADAYSIVGKIATLVRAARVIADGGVYNTTGQIVLLDRRYPLIAGAGVYDLQGKTANLNRGLKLTVDVGPYVLTGQPAGYVARAVTFSSDYLTRGAGLTGVADSKFLTFSCWLYIDSGVSGRLVFNTGTVGGGSGLTRIILGSSNAFSFFLTNAAGTEICNIASSNLSSGVWHHIVASVDLANTSNRHIYVDGVLDLATVTTYINDTVDFTQADLSIGGTASGGALYNGRMSELWYAPGVYIDLSVQANREKFRSSAGRPVDLGPDGSVPTGSPPAIFLSGPVSSWATNKGSGGGFTTNGALAVAAGP